MFKRFVSAIVAMTVATSASASVYRIDVEGSGTGQASGPGIVIDLRVDGGATTAGFVRSGWSFDFDDLPVVYWPYLTELRKTTGQAFFDPQNGQAFSGCSGLLLPLCFGSAFLGSPTFNPVTDQFDAFVAFSMGGSATSANELGLSWGSDEYAPSFFIIGDFRYTGGYPGYQTFGATFTRAEVSVVPLPAAGWLLLGALGGMTVLRRRKAI
jgi:hypothetical protein